MLLTRSALAAPADASLTVSVQGGVRRTDPFRTETVALVLLTIPLARFAGAPLAQDSAAPPAPALPAPAAAPPPAPVILSPRFARSAVRMALRAAGIPRSRARLGALGSRARSSAMLPALRLRAARTTDESLRLTPTLDDPYRYAQAGGTSLLFEARLDWKLDRLVFADEELGVERLIGERENAAARLAERVLRLLVAWQRARWRAADAGLEPERRALAELEAIEAELHLDVLTNGWFSEQPPIRRPRAP
jgi:hypothetical protein